MFSLARFFHRSALTPPLSRPSPRSRSLQAQRFGPALALLLVAAAAGIPAGAGAAPVDLDLNRALQIGWYSLRVQNPFGTNYTGLTAIKSYDPAAKQFVFLNQKGEDVVIKEEDVSFIYFRQLPDRADVNVKDGLIRNIQITPYREFLYNINPGRLVIQDGILKINSRWRIAEQKPFGVDTTQPAEQDPGEKVEITRRIQLNYLGNHYLVETELVNMVVHDRPLPGAGTVPRPTPSPFKVPAPTLSPNPAP
ncbi:MAG: hypothetical protein VKO39_00450 [Cyanobacteriota bacterium]|nr:hypothetical protein [Cyanobacteriota bacterium]